MKKDTIMGIWMFICIGITFVIAGSALGGFTTVTYAAPASGNYQIGGGRWMNRLRTWKSTGRPGRFTLRTMTRIRWNLAKRRRKPSARISRCAGV